MGIYEISPGTHTIKMSLNGYDDLITTINVETDKVITCIPSSNINCNSSTPPGLTILGTTITGFLKATSGTGGVCGWISNKGGPNAIISYDIMSLVQGYIGTQNLGFTVTSADIMGAIAYYSGNIASGNGLTGCNL